MTEFELFQALRPIYPGREYALLPQAANGTGAGSFRHADALALSLWPSRGMHLSGFEIKTYRGDWLRELKQPEKAEEIAQFCNFWWIVASGPFVKTEELPQPWGLMVWDEKANTLKKIKAAPFREAVKPDLAFIAAILRKAQEVVTPQASLQAEYDRGYARGKEEGQQDSKFEADALNKLAEKVKQFETASGISIASGWHQPKGVGLAVRQVINGTLSREREILLECAKRIVGELDVTA